MRASLGYNTYRCLMIERYVPLYAFALSKPCLEIPGLTGSKSKAPERAQRMAKAGTGYELAKLASIFKFHDSGLVGPKSNPI